MFPTFSYQYCAWCLSTHCCTYAESMQRSHNRTLQLQLWLALGFIWKQHRCIDCIRHNFTSHERVKCTCAADKEGKLAEHFTRKSMIGCIRINEILNFETREFFLWFIIWVFFVKLAKRQECSLEVIWSKNILWTMALFDCYWI
jgi:hypothetical protein